MGKYIADFYCAKAKLVIELDGRQHTEAFAAKKDAERTEYLEQYGITVIRIPNQNVSKYFTEVCKYIDEAVTNSTGESVVQTIDSTRKN